MLCEKGAVNINQELEKIIIIVRQQDLENVQDIANEVQRGAHKLISLEENALKHRRSWS